MRAIRPILEQELQTIRPTHSFPLPCPVVLTIPIPFPGSHLHRRGRHGAEDPRLVRTCIPDGGLNAIGDHQRFGRVLPVPPGPLVKAVLESGDDPLAVAHEVSRVGPDERHSTYWRVHPREWFHH